MPPMTPPRWYPYSPPTIPGTPQTPPGEVSSQYLRRLQQQAEEHDQFLETESGSWHRVEAVQRFASQTQLPPATGTFETSNGSVEVLASSPGECVVCLTSGATHVVVPCGHQCMCGLCAARI